MPRIPTLSTIYVLIAVPFVIILYFMDISNLRDFLLAGSYWYVGQNPYHYLSVTPPINFAALTLPTFAVYLSAGNNLIAAVTFIKIVQIAASIGSSLLVFRLVLKSGAPSNSANAAFFALLFSPVMFFISYIYVEQDVIGIFFALLALYLLLDSTRSKDTSYTTFLVGFLILWYSVFLYYFPIIFIPIVLFYQKDLKRLILAGSALAFAFLFFIIPFSVLDLWTFFSNITGTTSSGGLITVYSLLNLFSSGFNGRYNTGLSAANLWLTLLWICLLVAVPLLSRWLRYDALVPITALLACTFMLLQIYNGDEFVWVLPFAIILLAVGVAKRVLVTVFLVQLYMVPVLLLFNMWGAPGPGGGTGIFYLGYLQFGRGIAIAPLFPNPAGLSQALEVVGFLALGTILFLTYIVSKRRPLSTTSGNVGRSLDSFARICGAIRDFFSKRPKQDTTDARRNPVHRGVRRRVPWVVVGLLVIFVLSLLSFPPANYNAINVEGGSHFPLALFDSQSIMNGTLTYTPTDGGRSLYIAPASPSYDYPLNLSRNLTGEQFRMNLSVDADGLSGTNYEVPILQFGSLATDLSNSIQLGRNTTIIRPTSTENVSGYMMNNPLLTNLQPLPTYSLTGASLLEYAINDSESSVAQYYFLFHMNSTWYNQNIVYMCQDGDTTAKLFAVQGSYFFAVQASPGANWTLYPVSSGIPVSSWNTASFSLTPSSMSFAINNVSIGPGSVHLGQSSEVAIYVGKLGTSDEANYNSSFSGAATALLTSEYPYNTKPTLLEYNNGSSFNSTSWESWPYVLKDIVVSYDEGIITVQSNGHTVQLTASSPTLTYGRLAVDSVPLILSISDLSISLQSGRSYLYNVVLLTVTTPVYLIVAAVVDVRVLGRIRAADRAPFHGRATGNAVGGSGPRRTTETDSREVGNPDETNHQT